MPSNVYAYTPPPKYKRASSTEHYRGSLSQKVVLEFIELFYDVRSTGYVEDLTFDLFILSNNFTPVRWLMSILTSNAPIHSHEPMKDLGLSSIYTNKV